MTAPNGRRAPGREPVLPRSEGGLGTFEGVFTPSILTILGVIMYLRLGWVVGNVGIAPAVTIITLASAITFLTALSIAQIATDQTVRTGGAYYMISRSLGIEVGGAVGIPLYLAQGLSVALYTVGFAESVAGAFQGVDARVVGVIVTVLVAALALTSARIAIRAQYIIIGAIALSIVSLLLGGGASAPPGTVVPPRETFWPVFAVFFPAVTGIMSGVNLSGDLRDPARAIPRGTFAAIAVGYVVYVGLAILLATRADEASLLSDPLVMRNMAVWGNSILVGVWGATLSSAVGSMLGGPRVLQALARDEVLPRGFRWLGRGSGSDDTPRAGTLVTLVLALAAVWFLNLNIIAPILTMFFLTTYGVLNIAAGVERLVGSPSFRPTFRVHWSLSLLGAFACGAVMVVINPLATAIAVAFVLAVFLWLERRQLQTAWGDIRLGIWMALTRAGLMRVRTGEDPKNWRPHLLVLSGSPTRRWHLIDLASGISHNRGLVTVATVVPSDSVEGARQQKLELSMRDFLSRRGVQALARVIPADDVFAGARQLVETYGLGSLVPNTVLLGDTQDPENFEPYCQMIRRFHEAQRNVVIVSDDEDRGFGDRRRIDLWWGGLKGNGGLMMILAYLLQSSLRWSGAEVRVKMVVPTDSAASDAEENLGRLIEGTRINARPQVLVGEDRPFQDILHETSRDADLVLLGMAEPGDDFPDYYRRMRDWSKGLPATAFVLAAQEIRFGEVLR